MKETDRITSGCCCGPQQEGDAGREPVSCCSPSSSRQVERTQREPFLCCAPSGPRQSGDMRREPVSCRAPSDPAPYWVNGAVSTPVGEIPRAVTKPMFRDRPGTVRARVGFMRHRYTVPPGLYAVGSPTSESHVFATANYKMSFDSLRSVLAGRDAWIMVLDTKGINVWCSAGKGTFGTEELIRRARLVRLDGIVSHRELVLPQLGATGVSAHRVREQGGWRVIWGPVRAEDLPRFLDGGMKATPEMRSVRFSFRDRLELVPAELIMPFKYLFLAAVCFFFLSGIAGGGFSVVRMQAKGMTSILLLVMAYIAGTAVVPVLLPWIPGRAFSLKGAWIGLVAVVPFVVRQWFGGPVFINSMETWGWLLLVPAVSSFLAMNFTGSSTYTSLSGVRREMRTAVPFQVIAAVSGFGLWLAARFI